MNDITGVLTKLADVLIITFDFIFNSVKLE